MPLLYRLLIPVLQVPLPNGTGPTEKDVYSQIQWLQRSDYVPEFKVKKGWSNFPLMVWIVGYLVYNDLVEVAFGVENLVEKQQATLPDFSPQFLIGDEPFGLCDFILLILLDASNPDNEEAKSVKIRHIIQNGLLYISKQIIYDGLKNAFSSYFYEIFPEKQTTQVPQAIIFFVANGENNNERQTTCITTIQSESETFQPMDTVENTSGEIGTANIDDVPGVVNGNNENDEVDGERTSDKESNDEEASTEITKPKKKRAKKNKKRPSKRRKKGNTAEEEESENDESAGETKRSSTAKAGKVDKLPSETTVPKLHVDLPPRYINLNSGSWYWKYSDKLQSASWPAEVTKEDVVNRLHQNVIRLTFNQIAVQYARAVGSLEGEELFELLTTPNNTADEDKDAWDAVMKMVVGVWQLWKEKNLTICNPPTLPRTEDKTLLQYCERVLHTLLESSALDITNITPVYSCVWTRSEVANMSSFRIETVRADLHKLKCCILFDTICHNYFSDEQADELTNALFNSTNNKRGAPRNNSDTQKEWIFEFNLLLHHLPSIKSFSSTIGWTGRSTRSTTFSDTLSVITKLLWNDIPRSQEVGIYPGICRRIRPKFCEATVYDKKLLRHLKQLFFYSDGYLRPDLKQSLSFEPPHGFIKFGGYEINDVRWFLTLERVSPENGGEFKQA